MSIIDQFLPWKWQNYAVLDNGSLRYLHNRDLAEIRQHPEEYGTLWTGRIATALYGFSLVPGKEHHPAGERHCVSGNRGPTGKNEILIALGNSVQQLVELGFIPCPSCHPERAEGHQELIGPTIAALYQLDSIYDFAHKGTMPFDPRRLNWEYIVGATGDMPSRVYAGPTMSAEDAEELHERLYGIQHTVPPIGYYDRSVPGRFRVVVPGTK